MSEARICAQAAAANGAPYQGDFYVFRLRSPSCRRRAASHIRESHNSLETRRSTKTQYTLVIGAGRPRQSSQGPTSSHSPAPAMRHRSTVICTFPRTAGITHDVRNHTVPWGLALQGCHRSWPKPAYPPRPPLPMGAILWGFACFSAGGSILMLTCCVPDSEAQKLAGNPPLEEKARATCSHSPAPGCDTVI